MDEACHRHKRHAGSIRALADIRSKYHYRHILADLLLGHLHDVVLLCALLYK